MPKEAILVLDDYAMLEYLEQANLFLHLLDDGRQWYRYHHLFRDVLRQRLQQAQPAMLSVLHNRASIWYEHQEMPDEAISHALIVEDFERDARIIERVGVAIVQRGEVVTVQKWVMALPRTMLSTHLRICLFEAWWLALSGQFSAAEQLLDDYERAQGCAKPVVSPLTTSDLLSLNPQALPVQEVVVDPSMELFGEMLALRSSIALWSKDLPRSIELALQALAYYPANSMGSSLIVGNLGHAYQANEDIIKAIEGYAKAFAISCVARNVHSAALAAEGLASLQLSQGRLSLAEQTYQQALQLNALYEKLQVASRTQAIARARELSLLPNWQGVISHKLSTNVSLLRRYQKPVCY